MQNIISPSTISSLFCLALLVASVTTGSAQCLYTGTISSTDATHNNSLATSGIDSTAAAPQVCPGIFSTSESFHYDQFQFWNSSGASQTYTVTGDASGCSTFLMSSTYLDSLNTINLCSNYLASMGSGFSDLGSYEFTVGNGAAFKVIVEEFDPSAYCASYTITVTPCPTEGVPAASPTPTPTPVITPTPTPSGISISGRVLTPDLRGLRNAVVSILNSQGVRQLATTSSFGVFSFEGMIAGESYVVSVVSKRYRFTSRTVQVTSNVADIDFIGLE